MSRVKRGTTKLKHRKNILEKTKGMRGNIRKKERQANEVLAHAGNHAFQHRKKKKGDFRALWTVRINAALRAEGYTYSKFMATMKSKDIALNRKMLAEIAKDDIESFKRILQTVTK
ncbi:MAG: 50S ribosomal protein L20P [Parcubacteria group bacterium GW2011_GWA2_43_11]|nr:MAG: 50S ribosomal protein L20P [Parcubacteria group bacterium GW2011_GWA2_43_11]